MGKNSSNLISSREIISTRIIAWLQAQANADIILRIITLKDFIGVHIYRSILMVFENQILEDAEGVSISVSVVVATVLECGLWVVNI